MIRKLIAIGISLVSVMFILPVTAWASSSVMQGIGGYDSFGDPLPGWGNSNNPYVGTSYQTHGGNVLAVQEILNNGLGDGLTTDGYYGPNTESAIKNFQKLFGDTQDGIVGPNTWQDLTGFVGYYGNVNNVDEFRDTPGDSSGIWFNMDLNGWGSGNLYEVWEVSHYYSGNSNDSPGESYMMDGNGPSPYDNGFY